jgi:hypothetical protein
MTQDSSRSQAETKEGRVKAGRRSSTRGCREGILSAVWEFL